MADNKVKSDTIAKKMADVKKKKAEKKPKPKPDSSYSTVRHYKF